MRVCEHLDKLLFSLLNELIQVFAFPPRVEDVRALISSSRESESSVIDIVIPRSGYPLEAQPLKNGRPHGDKRNEPCRRTRQGLGVVGVPAYVNDGFQQGSR
jgi:hypothetical protein